jgi:hypothetical protein
MPMPLATSSSAVRGAWVPIAYWEADGTTAGTNFANIPQVYQDLVLVSFGRNTRAVISDHILMATNTDTSGIHDQAFLWTEGTATPASGYNNNMGFSVVWNTYTGASAAAGNFGSGVSHIFDYTNTSKHKLMLSLSNSDNNAGNGYNGITVNNTRSTAAVTGLYTITYNNLEVGSYLALYGIRKADY